MASRTVQEARQLCDQGKYPEAAGLLEAELEMDRNNIDLIVELGETLFTWGYHTRAAQILGDGLDHSEELKNPIVAAGLMIYYVSRVYSTCKFEDSLLRAEEIHITFRNSGEVESVNDATVGHMLFPPSLCLV